MIFVGDFVNCGGREVFVRLLKNTDDSTSPSAKAWSLGLTAFDLPNPFFSPIRSRLFTCHPNSTKLEYFQHISQLSKPDLLFQPPGSESNYAGFIFDGNFSKPGLARHQIKWKFVISFKYAKAFRIAKAFRG